MISISDLELVPIDRESSVVEGLEAPFGLRINNDAVLQRPVVINIETAESTGDYIKIAILLPTMFLF